MGEIVDWDPKPHLNVCVKITFFFYFSICELKTFYCILGFICVLFRYTVIIS